MTKPLILIAEDDASIPFDLAGHIIIRRPRTLDDESTAFSKALESAFAGLFQKLSPALEDEPSRLIAKKEYRAAVIAAFSLLEHELRQSMEIAGYDKFMTRSSLGQLLEFARSQEILEPKLYAQVRAHMALRNRIAHTRAEVSAPQASTLVKDVAAAVAKVREANLTPRSTGHTTAGSVSL